MEGCVLKFRGFQYTSIYGLHCFYYGPLSIRKYTHINQRLRLNKIRLVYYKCVLSI
jgi:hypothetical protein